MKSIEIGTAQNVVLEYELADLRDRVLAFFIDLIVLAFGLSILSVIGFVILDVTGAVANIYTVFLLTVFAFYSLAFEVLNKGQSLGKKILRIQVIKTVGEHAGFEDYVARWVFRIIDIYFSLGGIAFVLVVSSAKSQRIGDVVANTAVVKLVPKIDLNLRDILAIHSQQSYKPRYPEARQLHEEDVLLIKKTLDRYRRFNNKAHSEAVHLLAEKIKEVLGVENTPKDEYSFLQTILQDYVVLVR